MGFYNPSTASSGGLNYLGTWNAEAATDWVNSVRIAMDCKAKDDALVQFVTKP